MHALSNALQLFCQQAPTKPLKPLRLHQPLLVVLPSTSHMPGDRLLACWDQGTSALTMRGLGSLVSQE
jgi:hypothetical protein